MSSDKLCFLLLLACSTGLQAGQTVYDFSLASTDGKEASLKAYDGKVLLIVNVASKTIYSDQIPKLDALYHAYQQQGFVVIGIPSDDFGHGEPGKPDEVKDYYAAKMRVSFQVFAKAALTGKDQIPLYEYLTDSKLNAAAGGELPWNFSKYLIGRDGKPVARFDAGTPPDSPDLMAAVEAALEKKPGEKEAAK